MGKTVTSPTMIEKHSLREKKKVNKPLLERNRRARINECLSQLKHLILTSLDKDLSIFTKMEKADVLDMTVQYLKANQVGIPKDSGAVSYRAGFNECANDLIRYIMNLEDIDRLAKVKLLSYLASSRMFTEPFKNSAASEQPRDPQPQFIPIAPSSMGSQSPVSTVPSPTHSNSPPHSTSPQIPYSPTAYSRLVVPVVPTSELSAFVLMPVPEQIVCSPGIEQTSRNPKVSSNPRVSPNPRVPANPTVSLNPTVPLKRIRPNPKSSVSDRLSKSGEEKLWRPW
eukprot:gene9943-10963_t